MLKDNIINPYSEIRFIDIYQNKKINNFSYFKLQDLDNANDKNLTNFYDFLQNLNISNLVQNSLKGNKFYKIKLYLNKEYEYEGLEMIRKIENIDNIKYPKDLDNNTKNNLSSLLNKQSPPKAKLNENYNHNLLNSANNSFNKSNKIEKGISFNKNITTPTIINNNLLINSSNAPIKTQPKIIPLDIPKSMKMSTSPNKGQNTVLNANDKKDNTTINKSIFIFVL